MEEMLGEFAQVLERVLIGDRQLTRKEAMLLADVMAKAARIHAQAIQDLQGLQELDRGESVDLDDTIRKALLILNRAPDTEPDPDDQIH